MAWEPAGTGRRNCIRRSSGGGARASRAVRATGAMPRPAPGSKVWVPRPYRRAVLRRPRRSLESARSPNLPAPARGPPDRPPGQARGQALVQAVHNQHDGTVELVVEPAVEGMVEPLVGCP